MNEWNRMQMALDDSGLTESCDFCNALITNWAWMGMSFVTFEGRIACNDCRSALARGEKTLDEPVKADSI